MPVALGLVTLTGLAFLAFPRELPLWRLQGTASVPAVPVDYEGDVSLCPGPGQTLELRGDSLVLGLRRGGDTIRSQPYGRVMEQQFGNGANVLLHGQGGATAASGLAAWGGTHGGDIVLLAYGTNDAAVRGWIGGKVPVPLGEFHDSMVQHIRLARQPGTRVGLIAPPPVGAPAMMDRLQPYRDAVGQIGRQEGVPVFDPAAAFAQCREQEPLLAHDALHLNAAGHACLGRWLAQKMCGPGQSDMEREIR